MSHCLAEQLIELFSVSVGNQIWALDALVRLFKNILNDRFLVCKYMSHVCFCVKVYTFVKDKT